MHYNIFIDESGDTGLDFSKTGTTSHIVYAALGVAHSDLDRVDQIIVDTMEHFGITRAKELKFSKSSGKVREYLLSQIAGAPVDISFLVLRKKELNSASRLSMDPDHLHNYPFRILLPLFNELREARECEDLRLYIDGRDPERNKALKRYLSLLRDQDDVRYGFSKLRFEDSQHRKCLQLVDMVAGAVARSYERSDARFYALIKSRIGTNWRVFPLVGK